MSKKCFYCTRSQKSKLYETSFHCEKKGHKLDNNDIFIYMLSAGTDVAEHVAKFIYENLP